MHPMDPEFSHSVRVPRNVVGSAHHTSRKGKVIKVHHHPQGLNSIKDVFFFFFFNLLPRFKSRFLELALAILILHFLFGIEEIRERLKMLFVGD
ncbi:hypothetical protein ACOSQ4_027575 [Xanthoceras sorbifolium]